MWTSRKLDLGDLKLQVHYNLNSSSQTIIFLHGAMDNGLCYSPIADQLSEKYNIVMPDSRGHGLTQTDNDSDWTYQDMAADIKNLAEYLELESIYLIGHSMGGNIATNIAKEYPQLISKLILEDPGFGLENFSSIKRFLYKLFMKIGLKLLLRGDFQDIYKRGQKNNPEWWEDELKPWAESKVQFKQQNPSKLIKSLSTGFNWREMIKNIECPILLITSEEGIIDDDLAEEVVDLAENCKWVKIDDAGHNIRREQPDKFLSAVKQFLNS
ncbi:MAG: alpha/beta fold hydrolase [Candidatus Lokiarchaeota archaeon]|nr:alpha/beta fold hydrolase [Candidatus Lokiarchaeota archaeon]MBD3200137.1 alpha/beta fold hydrolase [Candidatus Lokiarchaeota archaeon]